MSHRTYTSPISIRTSPLRPPSFASEMGSLYGRLSSSLGSMSLGSERDFSPRRTVFRQLPDLDDFPRYSSSDRLGFSSRTTLDDPVFGRNNPLRPPPLPQSLCASADYDSPTDSPARSRRQIPTRDYFPSSSISYYSQNSLPSSPALSRRVPLVGEPWKPTSCTSDLRLTLVNVPSISATSGYYRPLIRTRPIVPINYTPRSRPDREDAERSQPAICRGRHVIKFREAQGTDGDKTEHHRGSWKLFSADESPADAEAPSPGEEQRETSLSDVAGSQTSPLLQEKNATQSRLEEQQVTARRRERERMERETLEGERMERERVDRERMDKPSGDTKTDAQRLKFRKYTVEDFNLLKVLGKGSFGKVMLAELKCHDRYFAIKCMKKKAVVEDDDVESAMVERKVLAMGTHHPFICTLFCTFQTDGYLFYVLEYLNGGDLLYHIQHGGRFEEERARFYSAEVVCALKFLHRKGVIYRDLKLDNVMLDEDGHVRLVDFGMCQCRAYREECLPSNFCGTPQYIAPEIIKGQQYNHSVDWWSFGVLLYEMLIGQSPFNGTDEEELFWCVCNEEPFYPRCLSKESTHLLGLLLNKCPSNRLGMIKCTAGDICDQAFFSSVKWNDLERRKVEPPFKPKTGGLSDISNFENIFTSDKATLSPADSEKLDPVVQEQFNGFSYTNPNVVG